MSVSWCSDARNQNGQCWSFNNNACVDTLKNAFGAEHHRLTTGQAGPNESPHGLYPMLLPNGMSGSQRLTNGARISYDQSRLTEIDYDLNYSSLIGLSQRATNFSRFDLRGTTANTTPLHPDWEADGNGINPVGNHPCAEYVYKKYYDYGRFEDAAATCKSDYTCVYNLAMTTATPGLNFFPLKKKHGATMTVQVRVDPLRFLPPPTPQIKNLFWANDPVYGPSLFGDWIVYRGRQDVMYGIGQQMGLAPDAMNNPYQIRDRWAWHQQMHDRQASENITYATYEDMELRLKRINELYGQLFSFQALMEPAIFQGILSQPPIPQRRCLYSPLEHCLAQHRGDPEVCDGLSAVCTSWSEPQLPDVYTRIPNYALPNLLQEIADLLIAEWDHKSPLDGVTVDHGCLDRHSNRCDWSPKMFAREYVGLFRSEREKDYNRCLNDTQEQFTNVLPHIEPTDNANTDNLESWMTRHEGDQYLAQLSVSLPWTPDGKVGSHPPPGGKSLGDRSFFAMNYSYSGGYDAEFTRGGPSAPSPQSICGVKGHVYSNLSATATVLSQDIPLIDFLAEARAGQAGPGVQVNGHLAVVNSQLSSNMLYTTGGWVSLPFNLSRSGDPLEATLFDQTIVIGAIPIHLHAGLDFSTGIDTSINGLAPQGCDVGGPAMTLTGNITPYANVSANLSAALGVSLAGFGAEAGVRGELSLLKASVPVVVTLSVAQADMQPVNGVAPGPGDAGRTLSLVLNAGSSVDLTSLSGSMSAYAEVCVLACWSVEKELFRWNGINLAHMDLFRISQPYPLANLATWRPGSH